MGDNRKGIGLFFQGKDTVFYIYIIIVLFRSVFFFVLVLVKRVWVRVMDDNSRLPMTRVMGRA